MATDFYGKQRATVNIGMALQQRGWMLLGFRADTSDSMSDYYSPAHWDGIATHAAYPGIVVAVNVNEYTVKNRSGKDETQRSYAPDEPCARCTGTGTEPGAISYAEALATPDAGHVALRNKASGVRLFVIGAGGMSPLTVSQGDYHDDGRPKCAQCHGRGHDIKEVTTVLFTWPTFGPNPHAKAWHVECNGVRIASGTGFSKCDAFGDRAQRGARSVCDEIEAAVKRAAQRTQTAATSGATTAAAATAATLCRTAMANGYTFTCTFDLVAGETIVSTEPRVAKQSYWPWLAATGLTFDRRARVTKAYRLVGADELATFFGPITGREEPAAATLETTPEAATPSEAPAKIETAPEPGATVYVLAADAGNLGALRNQVVAAMNGYAIIQTLAAEAKETLELLKLQGAFVGIGMGTFFTEVRDLAGHATAPTPAGLSDEHAHLAFVEAFHPEDWDGEIAATRARDARFALLAQGGWIVTRAVSLSDGIPVPVLKATIPGDFRITEVRHRVSQGYIRATATPVGAHMRYLLVRKGSGELYHDVDSGALDIALRDHYAVLTVVSRLASSLLATIRSGMAHLSATIYESLAAADADAPNHLIGIPAPAAMEPSAQPEQTRPRPAYFFERFSHNVWGGRPHSERESNTRANELRRMGWSVDVRFAARVGYLLRASDPTRKDVPLVIDDNRATDEHGNHLCYAPRPNQPTTYFPAWDIVFGDTPAATIETAPERLLAETIPAPVVVAPAVETTPAMHPDAPGQGRTHFYEAFYDADWGTTPKARKAATQRAAELAVLGWNAKAYRRKGNLYYTVSAFDPSVEVYTSRISLLGAPGDTRDGKGYQLFTRTPPALPPTIETAPEILPAEAIPAPVVVAPAVETTPELHPLTRIVQLREQVQRRKAEVEAANAARIAAKDGSRTEREVHQPYAEAHAALCRAEVVFLNAEGIPLAAEEKYLMRDWGEASLAKRNRDLRARAYRAAGWEVKLSKTDGAFYLDARNPWYSGATVQVIDGRNGNSCRRVTPENGGAQYQPVRLEAPTAPLTSDETPRPLTAPTVAIETLAAPVLHLPEPATAPVAGKGKKVKGQAHAGPMVQLAMF